MDREERIRQLIDKKDRLAGRLEKGRAAIRAEEARGGEKADFYFEYWLALLTDYEQTIDELRSLGAADGLICEEADRAGTSHASSS